MSWKVGLSVDVVLAKGIDAVDSVGLVGSCTTGTWLARDGSTALPSDRNNFMNGRSSPMSPNVFVRLPTRLLIALSTYGRWNTSVSRGIYQPNSRIIELL